MSEQQTATTESPATTQDSAPIGPDLNALLDKASVGELTDDLALAPQPEPPKEKPADPVKPKLTLEEVEKLAKDGKLKEIAEAFGFDTKGKDNIPGQRWQELRGKTKKLNEHQAALQEHEGKLNAFAQHLQETYAPIHRAKEAMEAGDLESFIEIITDGKMTPVEFAKALARQAADVDPVVRRQLADLRTQQKKLEADRVAAAEEKRIQAQLAVQSNAEQNKARGNQLVASMLSGAGDEYENISELASVPMFVDRVREKIDAAIARGWDPRQRTREQAEVEIRELAKKELLALRQETAILHKSTASRPADANRADRVETAKAPPTIRREVPRATPAPAKTPTLDDLIDQAASGKLQI